MGAVINLRPDVAKACVSYVPFVDVINTMLDDTLPLTVGEYLEWGNPNEEAAASKINVLPPPIGPAIAAPGNARSSGSFIRGIK